MLKNFAPAVKALLNLWGLNVHVYGYCHRGADFSFSPQQPFEGSGDSRNGRERSPLGSCCGLKSALKWSGEN